ncbi:ABC transporter substrate-binding protein [Aquabacterium sp. J223]|uniref:ABC transporter substrate-binding protein n=1 Tax=Aquabacterium sp. J223 TaxID=2898431 RepID=UPI0021AD80DA|nr:ABC transporter substrate-binding protein [Aquabacterium sp. J223]UUX95340.1 ABC transporter substrate-binding protein [Aquabacterium sp. J223]
MSTASEQPQGSPAPSHDGAPRRLRVAIVSRTFFYLPLWAALDRGEFERAGLQLEVSLLGAASQAEPLRDGALDIAIATPEAALQDAAAGGPLRIVAGNTGKLSHSLITRPPFPTVASLRGARLGILNRVEGSFFQLQAMMAHHGLQHPGDYEVVETGGVPPRHKALLEGRIDGGLQSIPWNYVAEEAGLNNLGDITGYVPDWQFVSVNVNRDWARREPDVLTRFLAVMLRSTEWVHTHRDEAAAIAERELPAERRHAERAWDYYTSTNALTRDLSVNRRGLEVVLDTQRQAGLLPPGAPTGLDAYVDLTWLDAARDLLTTDRTS